MMVAGHIHDALRQVQELKQRIIEKQRFKGYSGRARALSGTLALLAAVILSLFDFPSGEAAHITAWALVFSLSAILNFGAILYWFLFDPESRREPRRLRPLIDVLPPLAAGGVFTFLLLLDGLHQYLFGTWMCFYGLSNLAGRHALPRQIVWIGLYYLVAGSCALLLRASFLNPWPMGAVFFAGEWAAGFVLHYDEAQRFPLPQFLSSRESTDAKNEESL